MSTNYQQLNSPNMWNFATNIIGIIKRGLIYQAHLDVSESDRREHGNIID